MGRGQHKTASRTSLLCVQIKAYGVDENYNDDYDYEGALGERMRNIKTRNKEWLKAHKMKEAAANAQNKKLVKKQPVTTSSPQECVGDIEDKENRAPAVTKNKKRNTSLLTQPIIKIIQGRLWSPHVYRNARLAGLEVDMVWLFLSMAE